MYKWHGLLQEACTSALLLRSPARELRPTLHCAGPTRQGDDTMCPELEKRGQKHGKGPTRQGGDSPCAVLRVVSGAPVALLAHLVLDNLCELASVGQVLVR